ncbi:MAG TPA: HlyD family secretion protein [Candidatus Bathyarchaeia archaeon]|nr:HlyD family secretion protein [Candidatus Bathyarchaeia archaeon]
MADLDQEGISGRLRARFSTYQEAPPRRRLALLGILLVVVVALGFGVYKWVYWHYHVSTDDAYITAHIAPISARVPGTVVEVLVNDNQDVKTEGVLVRLDPRDYEVAASQARAAVEGARGDLENAMANVPLTDETTKSLVAQADAALGATEHATEMARHDLEAQRSQVEAKRAAVEAAEAAVRSAQAEYDRSKLDRDRIDALVKAQLVAQQDMDHAEAAYRTAAAALDASRRRLDQAKGELMQAEASARTQQAAIAQSVRRNEESRASLANARSQRQQVRVRQAQVEAAQGRLAQALANLQQAELNLVYCTIRAPITGRVSRKTVEPGQVVTAGQALLAVVDLDDVWVVANYKETELTEVRAGQRAVVTVDTYPGKTFRARVDSIQAGSGAVFSLLPPENATGNFVKVVQRVPVKLVFEKGENVQHLLVPGMSVVPIISLR